MGGVIGLDVGGANTKAVWRDGDERRVLSRPFEVWRDREALAAVLREVVADVAPEPVEAVALTTTAELSDAFRTKREGVGFVLDAAEAALGGRGCCALTTDGELVPFAEARARPLGVAAANWVASALAVAELHPDALMIDVGSTTVDVDPDRRRPGRRRRPHRPRPAAGRGARVHRRAAHQPRRDRARACPCAAARARSPRSCSRSAPTCT